MAQFDLHETAFPTLSDARIAQLGSCTAASLLTYAAGDVLVHFGDRDFKFFVVRSGEIEILDQTGDTPKTIAVHGRGEFTGDVSHLTGTPAIFTAVALSDCEVHAISGNLLSGHQSVSRSWRHHPACVHGRKTGDTRPLHVAALFSFIDAVPRTEWLPGDIETDARGFVRTGPAVDKLSEGVTKRQPVLLETSRRGVFAGGDVRASSVKRVASAVGEGSMAIQFVHEYLKEM